MAYILDVGFSVPQSSFSQSEIGRLFNITNAKAQRFFDHPHIQKRHLYLPPQWAENAPVLESTGQLLKRFKKAALELSRTAVQQTLREHSRVSEIDMICCVTSTGFLVPGLSALLSQELGLRPDCQRLDIVGMGCNAGLNGLNAASNWCRANPGKKALLICCEICSAIYNNDDSEESALVNSLFGDGVAAALLGDAPRSSSAPRIMGFVTHLVPDSLDLLRFDWDSEKYRFRFVVDKRTPQWITKDISLALQNLLSSYHLDLQNIRHWIVHSGGDAILSGIEKELNLHPEDLRHTRSVLRDFGNISSGSFLFSYSRLLAEKKICGDEYGVMITMGPGLTIEMALLHWGRT